MDLRRRPERGTGEALVTGDISTAAMPCFLAEIATQVAPGSHAVVVLDGAGWHQTGGDLRVPANISLLHLPPYAPELNPVENVWEYLRQNHLSNRVFETYAAIVDIFCDAWNALIAEPDRIRSIATREWAVNPRGRWYHTACSIISASIIARRHVLSRPVVSASTPAQR